MKELKKGDKKGQLSKQNEFEFKNINLKNNIINSFFILVLI